MATLNEDFDAAFARVSTEPETAPVTSPSAGAAPPAGSEAAKPAVPAPAAEATAAAPAAPAGEGQPAVEGIEEPAAIEPVVEPAEPVEPVEPGTQTSVAAQPAAIADEVLRRFTDAMQRVAPQPQQTQQTQQAPQPQLFDQDEMKFLNQYITDWPDIARAQQLQSRALRADITAQVYREFAEVVGPKLQLIDALAERAQLSELRRAVPDYPVVRDKVVAWVEEQPPYLRAAFNHVIQQGTEEEVVDLIDRYKQATGTVQATAAPAPAPVPAPATELSPAAKQAAARLAPVGSKRTATAAPASPETFDDAFAMFAAKA